MFAKAEWFRECTNSKRLVPARWQGWVYLFTSLGVVAVPAILLAAVRGAPEAVVWLVASLGFFAWEMRQVRMHQRVAETNENEEDVLYIGDDDNSSLATHNFEMRLRH